MNKQKIISKVCALSLIGITGLGALPYINNTGQQLFNEIANTYVINAETSNTKMKTTSSVNVRSGPSTKYKVLGKLKKGKTITVKSTTNGWAKFTFNGKTAYVSTKYLQKVTSSNTTTTSKKMKTTSSLNVRSGPSTKYKILGKLKKGQTITVKATTNGWAKFTYNGKTAYVSAKYLKKATSNTDSNNNNNENTNYPIAKNVTYSKIGVRKFKTDAYIRESATKGSKIIGIGKKGNMIEYVELVKTGLHKVIFNGKYAYIEDYDKNIDVFEVSTFGKLNGNTTNKYVKDFNLLANNVMKNDNWFWINDSKVSSWYGLVEFGTNSENDSLDIISFYTYKLNEEKTEIREKASLQVLTALFGEKNAKEILDIVLTQEVTYMKKTYNNITIEIDKHDYNVTLIHF